MKNLSREKMLGEIERLEALCIKYNVPYRKAPKPMRGIK